MPNIGIRQAFDLTTRSKYTKVACEVGMKLEGNELPNMAVLGEALEKAIELVQQHITDSYKVVPERDGATQHGMETGQSVALGSAPVAPANPAQGNAKPQVPDF